MRSTARSTRRFTVDDVLRMVDTGILREDEHVELLEGELVVVPPQGVSHAGITTELHERLIHAYGRGYVVREAKPMVAGPDSLPEPDIAVFRNSHRELRTRHPRADEAVLVVEVAKTSLALDHAKALIYARAGVSAYWLIDLGGGRLEVHSDPATSGQFRIVRVLGREDRVPLPGLDVSWPVRDLLPRRQAIRGGPRAARPRPGKKA